MAETIMTISDEALNVYDLGVGMAAREIVKYTIRRFVPNIESDALYGIVNKIPLEAVRRKSITGHPDLDKAENLAIIVTRDVIREFIPKISNKTLNKILSVIIASLENVGADK